MKLLFHIVCPLFLLVSLANASKNNNNGRRSNDNKNDVMRNSRGPVKAQRCKKNKNKNRCEFATAQLGLDDRNVDEIELDMKGDGTTIVCERQDYSANGLSWHGKCGKEASDANFVRRKTRNGGERIFGSVHMGDEICSFGPNADGVDEVECEPQSSYMEELPPHKAKKNGGNTRSLLRSDGGNATLGSLPYGMTAEAAKSRRRLFDDTGTTLDIMVVWTVEAECLYSGLPEVCTTTDSTEDNMLGLIDLAVEESNTAFTLSGINTQLRLVHAYQHPDYVEQDVNTFNVAVDDLRNPNDGELDDVHEKRALYGADLVALVVGGGTYCGVAYLGPSLDSMFSVTHFSCATGYYSFVHEIAHNLGSDHDRGTSSACDAQGYNYGWRDPNANFRTIMGYQCVTGQCDNMPTSNGCNRIQRFSTPDFEFGGRALGDAANDNARHMNERLATVAGYFPAMNCQEDGDCDDGKGGTVDSCNVEKRVCVFTETPTLSPTMPSPSASPSMTPSGDPTVSPTRRPSSSPSEGPSDVPSIVPSTKPSSSRSSLPSATPTNSPSALPSTPPSSTPSRIPSSQPSDSPSFTPSRIPSLSPTALPSTSPSSSPSKAPERAPTTYAPVTTRAGPVPTENPSSIPSEKPSNRPSDIPSGIPSSKPSSQPTRIPSEVPSIDPTQKPSDTPSRTPSFGPSRTPSNKPSMIPSGIPSADPSELPSPSPSVAPTKEPSVSPSASPSDVASAKPSAAQVKATDSPSKLPSLITAQVPRLEFLVTTGVNSESWKTVSLQYHYTAPIPVCTVDYGGKVDMVPAVVRMQNVRASSFQLKLQNPSGKDVQASDVHCMIVEKGAWYLPDGRMIEAHSYASTRTDHEQRMLGERQWYRHKFRQNPVILGQVMSYNDNRFSVFWSSGRLAHHVAHAGFLVTGKHVGKDDDVARANEVVGFIAIEQTHAISNDIEIDSFSGRREALSYTQSINRRSYRFKRFFTTSTPKVIVVSQAAQSGGQASWAVLDGGLTSRTFKVAIEEDEIGGRSRTHMWAEPIDGMAFSAEGSMDLLVELESRTRPNSSQGNKKPPIQSSSKGTSSSGTNKSSAKSPDQGNDSRGSKTRGGRPRLD